MRSSAFIGLAAIAFSLCSKARAEFPLEPCPAPFQKLLAAEAFSAYSVSVPVDPSKPVAPLVKTGEAHTFRTIIREQAERGPDFAGHYTIIWIGCGAATVCPAIVDALTGKVFFPPEIGSVTALLMDTGSADFAALNYRRDSRLLIVVGTPNEDIKKEGLIYYEWRSNKLTLVRFVPRNELCREQ